MYKYAVLPHTKNNCKMLLFYSPDTLSHDMAASILLSPASSLLFYKCPVSVCVAHSVRVPVCYCCWYGVHASIVSMLV